VILLSLAGCRSQASEVTPTSKEGFAIYLLAQEISPNLLDDLNLLKPAQHPLLSRSEIVSYTQATHEIELSAQGYEAIAALYMPVTGVPFVVCVDGQPIYAGAFWPGYSSLSYDGIVIDPILASYEQPFIHIQLGYPDLDFYDAVDPRSDLRILQALERAGKLK
jgi:hypothetical protein